jgi:hypothetical protein
LAQQRGQCGFAVRGERDGDLGADALIVDPARPVVSLVVQLVECVDDVHLGQRAVVDLVGGVCVARVVHDVVDGNQADLVNQPFESIQSDVGGGRGIVSNGRADQVI